MKVFNPLFRSRGAVLSLPYTFDPSGKPDGASPSPLYGPTWQVSSGKLDNSPALGPELLPDPGLEGIYTDGFWNGWFIHSGNSVYTQSSDVHGGSKAQEWYATAPNEELTLHYDTTIVGQWYMFSSWVKRKTDRTNPLGLELETLDGELTVRKSPSVNMVSPTYKQYRVAKYSPAGNLFGVSTGMHLHLGDSDSIIADDLSLKTIRNADLFALANVNKTDITAKARWDFVYDPGSVAGVVARADRRYNPQTYLLAYYYLYSHDPYFLCVLVKCVNGQYTELVFAVTNTGTPGSGQAPLSSEWLEIRCSGNTVQLFHNGTQVGADQTVSDVTGKYAGVFQTGGSHLVAFNAALT